MKTKRLQRGVCSAHLIANAFMLLKQNLSFLQPSDYLLVGNVKVSVIFTIR